MTEQGQLPVRFTSAMTKRELLCAWLWLPMHLLVLPRIALAMMDQGAFSETMANLLVYGAGALYAVVTCFAFLRRDFDALCDRPLYCAAQIALSYLSMMAFNLILSGILSLIRTLGGGLLSNQNNAAIVSLTLKDTGLMTAMAVFLAPIIEEVLFRGAIFGPLRHKNRVTAYLICMLLFSLYHVWGYALQDPSYWIFLLQYLPVGYLLCRCYERTDSIWCSIFFHMLINLISIKALILLEELL